MTRSFYLRFKDSGRAITSADISTASEADDCHEDRINVLRLVDSGDDAVMIARWIVQDLKHNWEEAGLVIPEIELVDNAGRVWAKWNYK